MRCRENPRPSRPGSCSGYGTRRRRSPQKARHPQPQSPEQSSESSRALQPASDLRIAWTRMLESKGVGSVGSMF